MAACSHVHLQGELSPTAARLVRAVQELADARDLETIAQVVREAARHLTEADGATFVLRENELCYYADEDAISPLWKGRRFPVSDCISGWAMEHREAAVIEDVYADPRIPKDVYAPTFVKSLAMIPIRHAAPVGAIGNYWRTHHRATPGELALLQALADSTAVALGNVAVHAELEKRVHDRTAELEVANRELAAKHAWLLEVQRQRDALNALIIHDLKSPAQAIMLAASLRLDSTKLEEPSRRDWRRVLGSAEQLHRTALNLLDVATSADGKLAVHKRAVDVAALCREVTDLFGPQAEQRGKAIQVDAAPDLGVVQADTHLLRRVLQNLVDNAVRHTPPLGTVRVAARLSPNECVELCVSDSGPGIPPSERARIFEACQSFNPRPDGENVSHGLGLTYCRLAVEAHGGRIWVEDNAPNGSRFCLRLPIRDRCPPECRQCMSLGTVATCEHAGTRELATIGVAPPVRRST